MAGFAGDSNGAQSSDRVGANIRGRILQQVGQRADVLCSLYTLGCQLIDGMNFDRFVRRLEFRPDVFRGGGRGVRSE